MSGKAKVVDLRGDAANPNALRDAHWQTTDCANADRFVEEYGGDVRFAHNGGGFHIFDQGRWRRDDTDATMALVKESVERLWQEVPTAGSNEERNILTKHALASGRAQRMQATLKLAAADRSVALPADAFDPNPWLFACADRTVDLRTGEARAHDRADLISKASPVPYIEGAECPRFEKAMHTIFDDDEELVGFVQRAGGYSLTGSVAEQALFFCEGGGCNGKSTLTTVLHKVAGEYAKVASPSLLMQAKHEPHPTEIADLMGARFVSSVETERDRRIAETKVKWLTGGDRLKARFMRADFFEFTPTHKFWLLGNHRPEIVGTDPAIWRRIYLIPFRVDLRDRLGRDSLVRDFAATLDDELPGILNWFIRGAVDWYEDGLRPPATVVNATAEYRDEQDAVGQWFEEFCERNPKSRTPVKVFFDAYSAEFKSDAISKRSFARELDRLGIPSEKVGGVKFRIGARLKGES